MSRSDTKSSGKAQNKPHRLEYLKPPPSPFSPACLYSRACSFSSSTIDIFNQLILWCRGLLSVSLPARYQWQPPLPAPVVTTKNVSRCGLKSHHRAKSPLVRTTGSDVKKAKILIFPASLAARDGHVTQFLPMKYESRSTRTYFLLLPSFALE